VDDNKYIFNIEYYCIKLLKTICFFSQEVEKRFADGLPLIDPIEDMGIKEKGLKDCVKVSIYINVVVWVRVRIMVFNTTFSNISVILWWLVYRLYGLVFI
jgi:hypothetical protein